MNTVNFAKIKYKPEDGNFAFGGIKSVYPEAGSGEMRQKLRKVITVIGYNA